MQIFPTGLARPAPETSRKLLRRSAPERLVIAPTAEAGAQAQAKHPPPGLPRKGAFRLRPLRWHLFQPA